MTFKFDPGNITIEWDAEARAAYVSLSDNKVVKSLEINGDITIDLDSKGHLVGIEWIAPENAKVSDTTFTKKINLIARKYHAPQIREAAKVLRPLAAA